MVAAASRAAMPRKMSSMNILKVVHLIRRLIEKDAALFKEHD